MIQSVAKSLALTYLIVSFTVINAQNVSSRFSHYGELHYRLDQRVITDESRPYLEFTYDEDSPNGPSYWPGDCNFGYRQSPIVYDQVAAVSALDRDPLVMKGAYNVLPTEVHVINNGHGATYSFVFRDNAIPQITGGPLNKEVYNFASFHFHYPCEHLPQKHKNNCKLELHFVHYNAKYGSVEEATNKLDGLAVVGLMYEENNNIASIKFPYLKMLQHVYQPNTDYTERKNVFTYADALGFTEFPLFVSYNGGLTTPECTETVIWIVVDNLFPVSCSKLEQFYRIHDSHGERLKRNNRPIQPLNDRITHMYNDVKWVWN
ncbi:carbonic anhydrase 1-like [Chironomus tepperi]|uniref:carbonic anhydrase 1-like n=1 Tax=Chironomus tepperi TaxID=113505 RepID=UPI00391F7F53